MDEQSVQNGSGGKPENNGGPDGANKHRARPGRSLMLYSAAALVAAIAGFLAVQFAGVNVAPVGNAPLVLEPQQQNAQVPRGAGSGLHKLIRHAQPKAIPELRFTDGSGNPRTLADFRGKVVLLNLWATWCAPCKVEMPALDKLQAELGGNDFTVLALSIDRGSLEKPRAFLEGAKLANIALYHDAAGESATKVQAGGLPVTLLLDREGREIARLLGPAEWDTPEAVDLVKGFVSGGGASGTGG